MILLQLSDFVDGKYNIPQASSTISANNSTLQNCIDEFEKSYIYKLLGVELGDTIISYIQNGSSGNTDYDKIIGEFSESVVSACFTPIQSLGLKTYLKACIYYEYMQDPYVLTLAGAVKQSAEVATEVSASAILRKAEKAFNGILGTAEAIQYVCEKDSTKYPGYAGQRLAVKSHQFFL